MDITDKYLKKMANIAEIQRNKPILLKGGTYSANNHVHLATT
jgi:hypothetical protein